MILRGHSARRIAAEALGSMVVADKRVSEAVVHLTDRSVASLLAEAQVDRALSSLDHDHVTPTFLWDEEIREEVLNVVEGFLAARNFSPDQWRPAFRHKSQELCVGGIYLHLFNNDPLWPLAKPSEFFEALLT